MGGDKGIGTFRGKKIEDMDKSELLTVIEWLAAEMIHYKQSAEKNSKALESKYFDEIYLTEKGYKGF